MKRVEAETFISKHMPSLFRGVQLAWAAGSLSNAGSAGSEEIQPGSRGTGFALQKPVHDLLLKGSLVEQY